MYVTYYRCILCLSSSYTIPSSPRYSALNSLVYISR